MCTNEALSEVAKELNKNGVETEILWIGNKPIQGCICCLACRKKGGNGECPFADVGLGENALYVDVKTFAEKAKEADGFVFGSPVYYAGVNGSMHAFMDRLFFAYGEYFRGKVGACVVSARRAGTTASVDNLNKYLLIKEMPVASSNYWNAVHGSTPEDVRKDEEGLQTMRILGRNMAWMLKCIHSAGIPFPEEEEKIKTNFIR